MLAYSTNSSMLLCGRSMGLDKALALILMTYMKNKTFGFEPSYLTSPIVLGITFFGTAGFLVFEVLQIVDGKGKHKKGNIKKATDSKGRDVDQYFDKDFVSNEDLKKNKAFNYHNLQSIRSAKKRWNFG